MFTKAAVSITSRSVVNVIIPKRCVSLSGKAPIIPPNVASIGELGRLQSTHPQAHPRLFAKMKIFYNRVPKGPAPKLEAKTFWQRYYQNYVEKDSLMPLVHLVGVLIPLGYCISLKSGKCFFFYFSSISIVSLWRRREKIKIKRGQKNYFISLLGLLFSVFFGFK